MDAKERIPGEPLRRNGAKLGDALRPNHEDRTLAPSPSKRVLMERLVVMQNQREPVSRKLGESVKHRRPTRVPIARKRYAHLAIPEGFAPRFPRPCHEGRPPPGIADNASKFLRESTNAHICSRDFQYASQNRGCGSSVHQFTSPAWRRA